MIKLLAGLNGYIGWLIFSLSQIYQYLCIWIKNQGPSIVFRALHQTGTHQIKIILDLAHELGPAQPQHTRVLM